MLLRPKTGLNDMVVELTPGTRQAGEIDHASRTHPDHPDAAQRQHRRVPGGAGRRHAQLPAAAGRRRRPGAGRQRQEPRRRPSAASSRPTATSRRSPRRCRRAATNISALDPQLQGADRRRVGDKDQQLVQLVDASNAVFKSFANQDAKLRETLQPAARHAEDDRHRRAEGRQARPGRSGPTLGTLRPAPARSARR